MKVIINRVSVIQAGLVTFGCYLIPCLCMSLYLVHGILTESPFAQDLKIKHAIVGPLLLAVVCGIATAICVGLYNLNVRIFGGYELDAEPSDAARAEPSFSEKLSAAERDVAAAPPVESGFKISALYVVIITALIVVVPFAVISRKNAQKADALVSKHVSALQEAEKTLKNTQAAMTELNKVNRERYHQFETSQKDAQEKYQGSLKYAQNHFDHKLKEFAMLTRGMEHIAEIDNTGMSMMRGFSNDKTRLALKEAIAENRNKFFLYVTKSGYLHIEGKIDSTVERKIREAFDANKPTSVQPVE
ncbi:MAG: hypothetical protein K0R17_89 [Rariglobus sp.]|jgi:hypothetical protein|nr:hypothetical protein [Rariglobus sp.]